MVNLFSLRAIFVQSCRTTQRLITCVLVHLINDAPRWNCGNIYSYLTPEYLLFYIVLYISLVTPLPANNYSAPRI